MKFVFEDYTSDLNAIEGMIDVGNIWGPMGVLVNDLGF